MTKIVKKDATKLVQKIDDTAVVRASGSWNVFLRPNTDKFKPLMTSAMAKFATRYAPFDIKIVDLYRTIAINSKPFRTTARIPMTSIKTSNHMERVSAIPP